MANRSERLTKCFLNVFPELSAADAARAEAASMEAWDSVAHITLLAAISEEFGIEFEPEDYEELTSYQALSSYLDKTQVR